MMARTFALAGSCLLAGFVACSLVACSQDGESSTHQPQLTGDTCVLYSDATACQADSDCTWFGTGCACPPNDPSCTCSEGTCGSIHGTGSGSGSGTAGAGCACPGGDVCFEQIGSPAQTTTMPEISCITPAAGSGDPCARIQGQGTCAESPTVAGLCVCDNGIR